MFTFLCFNTNSTVGFIVYHALSGGGGASDVLPFPAESATIRGDCLLSTFCHSDWSGGSMILSADEYTIKRNKGNIVM